jgi:hypothetical protein
LPIAYCLTCRLFEIAIGSASEAEYHLLLAKVLGYPTPEAHRKLHDDLVEVRRMLGALIRRLRPLPRPRAARERPRPTADS